MIGRMLMPVLGLAIAIVSAPLSAQNLLLTLANEPPVAATIGTRAAANLALTVMPGATVTVARERGRDYRLQSGAGLFWTQVEEVPRDAESVTLTPRPLDDGSFEVTVAVLRKVAERRQRYLSTVIAPPGEWVRLLGPAENAERDLRVYSTRATGGDSLYLQIVPAL